MALRISYKFILVLAIVSLVLSIATLYLDATDTSQVQGNSTAQFQVGVTVRPKSSQNTQTKPQEPKARSWFSRWFWN